MKNQFLRGVVFGFFLALMITIFNMANAATGIDNNNPMNIRISADQWQGATGDDGTFTQFISPLMGIRAAARVLRTYRDKHGLNTIAGIVSRWAPPFENDTESYIKNVAFKLGIGVNVPLTDAYYVSLIGAMIYQENGQQPYSAAVIRRGFMMGFYRLQRHTQWIVEVANSHGHTE